MAQNIIIPCLVQMDDFKGISPVLNCKLLYDILVHVIELLWLLYDILVHVIELLWGMRLHGSYMYAYSMDQFKRLQYTYITVSSLSSHHQSKESIKVEVLSKRTSLLLCSLDSFKFNKVFKYDNHQVIVFTSRMKSVCLQNTELSENRAPLAQDLELLF